NKLSGRGSFGQRTRALHLDWKFVIETSFGSRDFVGPRREMKTMRTTSTLVVVAFLAVTASAQLEFRAKDLKQCEQSAEQPELTIRTCTRLIETFAKQEPAGLAADILVSALHHRSRAYQIQGDLNRQIGDLSRLVVLRPND